MKRLLIASLLTIVTAGGTLGLASTASAGTNSPRIDRREARQQNRIYQGVGSGSLTPQETYRLERRQASIRAQEAQFKSDGHLTRRERTVLNNRLDRSSRAIYRAKHNNRHY
jgi:uncharacterized membrane protein YebE (DUF533 family)